MSFRPRAPALDKLRRRTPVRAYAGAAEILGTLVFEKVPAGPEAVAARLHLRAPLVAVPGAAFVLRRLSPKDVLGGGTFGAAAGAAATGGEPAEIVAVRTALRDAGLEGTTPERAGAVANLRAERAAEILEGLQADGLATRLSKPAAFVDSERVEALFGRVRERLEAEQKLAPWRMGMTLLALARALALPEPALARVLGALAKDGGWRTARGISRPRSSSRG